MAQTPVPPQPPALLTPALFLQKATQLFPTQDNFEIEEVDLRVQAADIADLFLLWNQLGKTLLLDTVAGLAVSTPNQRTLVVNQLARVATGGEYVLKADSNGPMWAYASLNSATRVRVRWLPIGDPTAHLNLFPVLELVDHRYAAGDVVQHTFSNSGQTILLEVRRALPLAGAGLNNPVPTGLPTDPNYRPFAPLFSPQHNQNTDIGTNSDLFVIGLDEFIDASGAYYRGLLINRSPGFGFFGVRVQSATGQRVWEPVHCANYVRGSAGNVFVAFGSGTTTPPGTGTGASSIMARLYFTYSGPNHVVELPPGTTEVIFVNNESGRGIHDAYLTLDLDATPQTLTVRAGALAGDACYGRILVGTTGPDLDPTGFWDTARKWSVTAAWKIPASPSV